MRRVASLMAFVLAPLSAGVAATNAVPEALGAIKIPCEMPYDGQATIALYTPGGGQLVRSIAQIIELRKGTYFVRWDGMDLWGRLLPAGTELVAKVFTNPGLRAFYEFTVGHAGHPPWLTKPMGEGEATRTGGWMGDHTPPKSVLAFGDRLFFGCECAEHGHALIVTNLEGQKLWGRGGLTGWRGPTFLATDYKAIFAVAGRDNLIYRIDPRTWKATRIHDYGQDKVQAFAARDGKVLALLENHKASLSPFLPAVGEDSFDFDNSRPLIPKGWKPVEHQLSPRERFATTFYNGRHGQTGFRAVKSGAMAFALARFAGPTRIGTIVVDPIPGAASLELYTLKPGVRFDPRRHEPGEGFDLSETDLEGDWVPFGRTSFARPLNILRAAAAGLKTEALLLRILPPRGQADDFRPTVGMCRVLRRRVRPLAPDLQAIIPTSGPNPPAKTGKGTGPKSWHFETQKPISEAFPATVVLDLKRETSLDGLCLLGCTNPIFAVDALKKGKSLPSTRQLLDDGNWTEITVFNAGRTRRTGWATARGRHKETFVPFLRRISTRAIRIRYLMGYGGGKWGDRGGKDDPRRVDCGDIAPVVLLDESDRVPTHYLDIRDGATGRLIASSSDPSLQVAAMVFDREGSFFTVAGPRLCRSEFEPPVTRAANGFRLRHAVLNEEELAEPISIAVSDERVAVGDIARHAVIVFDKRGRRRVVIGDRGPRKRGPWDPNVVERPSGVGIDSRGKVWVAERLYSPKRISRFSADGKFEKEFLGPAEYGGGGFLDPDLANFYYRSMHLKLDWAKGTWRLANLNDRLYSEESPALETNSFVYTKVGRPVYCKGRRYMVGDPGNQGSPGVVICILEDGSPVWRPVAVMGKAHGSPFLLRRECWRRHWLAQDLTDRSFIWCDRNGDGRYQAEEVELVDQKRFGGDPFAYVYWGNWLGPDLTFWGRRARLAPTRITGRGVPIYEAKNIQPFSYSSLAPVCTSLMRCGMRAKPGPGNTSIVLHDGSLIVEGQPYLVKSDLTVLGGEPAAKPADYIPSVYGQVLDNPLHFVGTALTDSPVGEVAMVLGNSGRWFVESARDRVAIGWLFTGKEGGWGTDLPERRGVEVTHRRLGSECFFGHFIKAKNGKYYVVAGHTFHAISRVEGLDDFKTQTSRIEVDAESVAANSRIRRILKARARAASAGAKAKKSLVLRRLERRARGCKLDGYLREWGGRDKMVALDPKLKLCFDGACSRDGLYLAFTGTTPIDNHSEDPRYLFKTGFALDMRYRTDLRNRSRQVVAGDRRLVVAPHKGRWLAVLYDYVDPDVPSEKWVEFSSPWVTTRVARVAVLPPEAARIVFRVAEDLLNPAPQGKSNWSAEVFVTWDALGIRPEKKTTIRADFGVHIPDASGAAVGRRIYWTNCTVLTVSDLGVEAMLNPAAWGSVTLEP